MKRRDALLQTLATNPLAPYVIRSIDVGSEPLYDCSCQISCFVPFGPSFSAATDRVPIHRGPHPDEAC